MIIKSQEDYGKFFNSNVGKCILINSYDSEPGTEYSELKEISKEELIGYRKAYNQFYHIIRLKRRFKMLEEPSMGEPGKMEQFTMK